MARGGRRPGAGRPKGSGMHMPSPAQRRTVEAMAGFGIPADDIARVVGISTRTLEDRYPDELATGHVRANVQVARNLFTIATGTGREAVSAAIFWMKARAGWSEFSPPPAPKPSAPPPLGKKEQAEIDAETAAEGTAWGHLIH